MFKPLSSLRILALGLLVLPGIAAQAAAPVSNPPRITPELIAEIGALIPQEMSRFDIPGAALALIQDGAVVYARGFGYGDVERGKPFTPDTIHRIGSTTQSMTSLLAAIQVERGILGWDTPIRLISPLYRFPTLELTKTLTVRQLLGMGTGLAQSPLEPYIDLQSPRNFLQTNNKTPHYFFFWELDILLNRIMSLQSNKFVVVISTTNTKYINCYRHIYNLLEILTKE